MIEPLKQVLNMIPINNNLSVLPFYTNIDEQNGQKEYAYGEQYPLFCPLGHVPTFQIIRPHAENSPITHARLYNANRRLIIAEFSNAINAQLEIHEYPEYGIDVLVFPDNDAVFVGLPEGMYFMILRDANSSYYSDVFCCVPDISPYIKIEWWDNTDIITDNGIIYYNEGNFKNKLYLCTQIGKPDYNFEEEGENRNGYFFATKQLSEKTYKFTFLAPEYLCDVMRLIRMADNVRITDAFGKVYNCDTFLMTPNWLEQGNLASVEVEFQTDTIVKKIGKGYTKNV